MHHFEYRGDELYCEQVPLKKIVEQVGSPVYVYSHATLARHFKVFDDALAGTRHLICYSVKANSNLAVLRSLVAVRLGRITPVLIAAPAYLDRAPPLKHPRELPAHAVVGFGRERRPVTWSYVGRGGRREQVQLTPRAIANSFVAVRTLCEGGVGLAQLPAFVTAIAAPGALVPVEPGGFRPAPLEVAIVMPSGRQASPKLAAFVDMMRAFVTRHPELFEPL